MEDIVCSYFFSVSFSLYHMTFICHLVIRWTEIYASSVLTVYPWRRLVEEHLTCHKSDNRILDDTKYTHFTLLFQSSRPLKLMNCWAPILFLTLGHIALLCQTVFKMVFSE